MNRAVAECLNCDEIAVGEPALEWALRHTEATGHPTTTREAI